MEGYLVETRHNTYHDGYRIIDKNGINYDELDYYEPSFISYVIDKTTICQCTGLKDKNGKLIWENDIVEVKNDKHHFISQIEWDNWCKGFMFQDTKTTACGMDAISDSGCYRFACEVIGNIFDNPELMHE